MRIQKSREPSPIGVALARTRHAAGLTQTELAKRANLARATIANLESGFSRNVDVGTLSGLAAALGVRTVELLGEAYGNTPIEPLLSRFLASPVGRQAKVTAEEEAWFRELPGVFWIGLPPNEASLHLLLLARRASRAG